MLATIIIILIGVYGLLVPGPVDGLRGYLEQSRWNPKPHHDEMYLSITLSTL